MYYYLDSTYEVYEDYTYGYSTRIVESKWVPIGDAVDVVNKFCVDNYYRVYDLSKLRQVKIVDELHLVVPYERLLHEFSQAPWKIWPTRLYYGWKRSYHRPTRPRYKHFAIEQAFYAVEDIPLPNPEVPYRDFPRHRARSNNHRSWKRYRKHQWKDTNKWPVILK